MTTLARCYAVLRHIEWAGMTDYGSASCCPECSAYPDTPTRGTPPSIGFGLHCDLAAALRELEAGLPSADRQTPSVR